MKNKKRIIMMWFMMVMLMVFFNAVSVLAEDSLPSKYGNNSKAVYDQESTACCWAFAGTSLFEYAVDHKENVVDTSFSVEHMVEKMSKYGNDGYTAETKNAGGTRDESANYFVSGYGPVNAEDYPWLEGNELVQNYYFGRAEYRATEIMYMKALGWRADTSSLSNESILQIKQTIYKYGAVLASLYMGAESEYMSDNDIYYFAYDKKDHRTNHEGVDYTLTYSNNVEVGTATITINGIGNFTGTITRTFTIE